MTDILLVAYHYPPIASAGTARAVSLVRHLPDSGFRPHVLTTDAFGVEGEGSVYRAGEWVGWYRRLFNPAAAGLPTAARSRARTRGGDTFASRVGRSVLVPDAQIGWLPTAYRTARHILNTHPVRLILTTGPPFSAHLLGLALHHTAHLPWIADFRDTWTYDPLDAALTDSTMRLRVERWLESRVLATASHVTCVTDVAADVLASTPGRGTVTVVPNGYDAATPAPGAPVRRPKPGRFRFVHTGSFSSSHPRRSPKPLVEAAMQLVAEADFEIVFVGALTAEEKAVIEPLAAAGRAIVTGAVDREAAGAWQRGADALVVVDHPRDVLASNVPGKLYEYGAAGKPILAVAPAGATRRLIRKTGAGVCVGHAPEAIADAMRDFVAGRVDAAPDPAAWTAFDRRRTVARMAELMRGVLERPQTFR